jgi:hypothetical protein
MYWGDYVAVAIALFTSGFTLGLLVARRAVTQWLARQR